MARPAESELLLLKALWRDGRLSAREIHDRTQAATGWSPSATRKTLDRMKAKGLISTEIVHGVNVFRPTRDKVEILAGLIHRFTRDVLDADGPLPAAAFTGSRLLDADEIDDLERLLTRREEEDTEGRP